MKNKVDEDTDEANLRAEEHILITDADTGGVILNLRSVSHKSKVAGLSLSDMNRIETRSE